MNYKKIMLCICMSLLGCANKSDANIETIYVCNKDFEDSSNKVNISLLGNEIVELEYMKESKYISYLTGGSSNSGSTETNELTKEEFIEDMAKSIEDAVEQKGQEIILTLKENTFLLSVKYDFTESKIFEPLNLKYISVVMSVGDLNSGLEFIESLRSSGYQCEMQKNE